MLITGLLLLGGCTYNMYPNQEMLMRNGPPAADLSAYRSVQERPGQDPEIALAMALSGGGARAYHFAMGIMLELEEMGLAPGRNVLREVDYFSTVSGGGFAAGAWIAELKRDSSASLAEAWDAHIAEAFSRSYAIPIARGYVSPKVFLTRLNAGDPLEKVIDKRVLGGNRRHTVLLGDMYLPVADSLGRVRLPMIASNSTVYYNMAILPFTPNVLSEYRVCGYTHRMHLYRKRTPVDPYKMPLSVGLRASGSFPIFVPPALLTSDYNPGKKFLRLIDGGVADNVGYRTAISLLSQEKAPRKVMMVVDVDLTGPPRTFVSKGILALPLGVALSLPTSGLSAERSMRRQTITDLCKAYDITPIHFAIYDLLEGIETAPPKVVPMVENRARMVELLKDPQHEWSTQDLQLLNLACAAVLTKYSILPEEADLLIGAGRLLVHRNREKILQIFAAK